MKINIGPKTLLEKTPVSIDLNGDPFILHFTDGIPVLYSAICPHQHNIVSEFHENFWKCPSHDWTFETNTGKSINAPQKCLTKFLVEENNGSLFVTLPEKIKNKIKQLSGKKIPPKITVVGSAALLIQWESFNIICDPWIEGPAVFGSWITYPPSNLTIDDLPKIDAILISHEHSDHFHQFTLSKLDKKIPVYVPDVDNERLSSRLDKLGFENIISLHSGTPQKIQNEIQITSFNSGSVWSDNIFYIQLGNFSILNINDAGFNWAIKNTIDSVDLLCIQFSPGSGFPTTWTHLDEQSKLEIMNSRNQGMLRMIKQITELMNPEFILPFANFNTLYLSEHQKYVKMQPKNTPNDIVNLFKDNNHVKVIDIFPGESWDGKNNSFDTQTDHDKFYDNDFMFSYLNNPKRYDENEKFIPKNFELEFNEIKNYFEGFSDSKLTQSIGDYTIQLISKDKEKSIDCIIEFKEGSVTCSKNNNNKFHMSMLCPGGIIQEIIRNDLSWDELQAGYWAVYERHPDVYNIALWQLFHAPWQARKNYLSTQDIQRQFTFDKKSAIADIIENGDQKTIQVLEKFGLYCVGCEASVGESIEDGCSIHGLTQSQTNDLIKELKLLQNNE
jgi:CMP-N-acetylneuraminate monooxygenase